MSCSAVFVWPLYASDLLHVCMITTEQRTHQNALGAERPYRQKVNDYHHDFKVELLSSDFCFILATKSIARQQQSRNQ